MRISLSSALGPANLTGNFDFFQQRRRKRTRIAQQPASGTGGGWWGKGDEKVLVDDESRPSIFGTGSEDYFNYSWSEPDIFAHPYCGQPRTDGPGNRGLVTNYRWHILDLAPL